MISGTFHTLSQEWRYFSREKSIVHTLHLSQLVGSNDGATVLIASTSSTGTNGEHTPTSPLQVPPAPYFGINAKLITNSSFITDCYGSTNYLGQITAQSKMGIDVAPERITMTPEESGWFLIHAEAQGDKHTLGYQGPASDGKIMVQILNGGHELAHSIWELYMVGEAAGHYLDRLPRTSCETISVGGQFIAQGTNLGTQPPAYLSMWCVKVAEL